MKIRPVTLRHSILLALGATCLLGTTSPGRQPLYVPKPAQTSSAKPLLAKATARPNGEDPFSFYTQVSINGNDAGNFVVDTGASDSTISVNLAKKLGLNSEDGEIVIYTLANGHKEKCRVAFVEITVGQISRDAPVSICRKGVSLLGMSFVTQTTAVIRSTEITFY